MQRLRAVEKQEPTGLDPVEHRHRVEQRRVLHDDRVGRDDRLVRANGSVVDATERDDRRARPLRPEARERLRVLALEERGDAEELRGRDRALPAASVEAHLEHNHSAFAVVASASSGARFCASSFSIASTRSVVRTNASAFRLIESMPRSTRNAAKSG